MKKPTSLPDELPLTKISKLLTGNLPNDDGTKISENCLEDLLELINTKQLKAEFEGESTLREESYYSFFTKDRANHLTVHREDFINSYRATEQKINLHNDT